MIDISMPVFAGMPGFPDDPPVLTTRTRVLENGDAYNLSTLTVGTHTGTHIDPPRHFIRDGSAVDAIDLATLNGPCRVLAVEPGVRHIGPAEIRNVPDGTARLLLKTGNSARWLKEPGFFSDYAALTLEGARALLHKGVRLIGIDALSIESGSSGEFPVHHALLGGGVLILEGLLLAEVKAGAYRLTCLPLRLRDGDGAPARALLDTL